MNSIPVNGLLAVLAGVCSISFIYFGVYIISSAWKDIRFRPLIYLCFISSVWCLCFVMYFFSGSASGRELWQKFTFAGLLSFTLLLSFFLRYTGLIKNRKIALLLSFAIWLPPIVSVYENIFENAVLRDFPFGFWFLYTEIQTTVYNLVSIFLLIIFSFRLNTNKSKRQAYILCGSAIVLMAVSWAADYISGFQGGLNIIPFWLLLWIGIVLYTIKKYRFIIITPGFINRDITENIEEGIILLDPGLRIIFYNSIIQDLLNIKAGASIQLEDIVLEKHILNDEFSKLNHTGEILFKIRINIKPSDSDKKLPMDLKVKKIIDSYHDITGFLIIASKVKDIKQLELLYKISPRELDVIRLLIIGRTNKAMADFLEISERTIETHITSIYNKLGIRNRIELFNLLADFNIIHDI